MKTNLTKKVKVRVKDILFLWKQLQQGKWKWTIFLFYENKSNKESQTERYSYLVKTSPPRKVRVKDILILWKLVQQRKWKWKIFLFCENKFNMESESERYSYLVKTSPTKKVKVNDFFMFNFSKGLGAPIGSLVLGRYLPWSSFVCWITKRKKAFFNQPSSPSQWSWFVSWNTKTQK